MLDPTTSHAIDLTEAAYDLEKTDADWLASIIEVGAPILDQGPGVYGFEFVRPPPGGGGELVVIRNTHLRSLGADFPERLAAAMSSLPADLVHVIAPPGYAGTWRGLIEEQPEAARFPVETLGFQDLLAVLAVDPSGFGVEIVCPLEESTRLAPKARQRWQMLCAHLATAHRLRRGLEHAAEKRAAATALPRNAEALLDASGFRIVDRVGPAQEPSAIDVLRDAARAVDKARGKLRREDPKRAMEIWTALVDGRWSMVDWFDTDGRRFVLAIPNPPEVRDPRGLSDKECLVAAYLTLGEPNKLIAYRLGLSPARVSNLVRSSMHKLGAKNRADLIRRLRPMGIPMLP